MPSNQSGQFSRRSFVKSAAAATAVTSAFPGFVVGAKNDKPIKVGVVGCGGRGSGAAENALDADKKVKVVALADIYEDKINGCRDRLKKRGNDVEDKNCFLGFDAFRKVLDTDVDYVILATPPYYRPEHLGAAIAAGKHVFMEKPVAVDPVGIQKVMKTGRVAEGKKLCIAAGTQRRHQNGYIETIKLIKKGAIGEIISAECHWDMSKLWCRTRAEAEKNNWSEQEWMHRDWVNWTWLSGDHIVEQHVHNIDVINWVLGTHPISVVAFGSRLQRPTGNQFDNFSAGFEYPNNVHVHSTCRQIPDCQNNVSERVFGQKGVSNCNGWLSNWGVIKIAPNKPYVQEHADLIAAIRGEAYLNEAKNVAESTLCAIMARISAYTGKTVTWEEMMQSDMVIGPPSYELTDANIKADVASPGKAWF